MNAFHKKCLLVILHMDCCMLSQYTKQSMLLKDPTELAAIMASKLDFGWLATSLTAFALSLQTGCYFIDSI